MLAYWRQHSSLGHKWGVLEYEAEETERPQFIGACVHIYIYVHTLIGTSGNYTHRMYVYRCVYDEENDEWTKEYSTWRRFVLKYTISTPVLICFILVVLCGVELFEATIR